jgi:RND family efflux transporter MFP subunit
MQHTALSLVNCSAIATILLSLTVGCERFSEGTGGQAAPQATLVEVVRPERQTVRRSVGEPGELQAFETTAIHAKIPGYVKTWSVNIGAAVKKGQTLAELYVPEMEAEVQQKKAAVAQAVAKRKLAEAALRAAEANMKGAETKLEEVRASVNRAKSDLAYAQSQMRRVTELVKDSTVTERLLDETRSKLDSAEATLDEVQAQVKTAEVAVIQARAARDQASADLGAAGAAIDVAKEDARHSEALLGYARIEAPYDGIITQRNVDTGTLIQPGADQPPLYMIARSDIITIWAAIPERFAPAVNPGDRALIKVQALPGRIIEGKVTRLSWALNPKVRTLRVEIDIPNPDAKLEPGLYAYATVIAEEHPNVLTVPATAIITENGKSFCNVVTDGNLARRSLTLGLTDGTRTEVVSGLDGSEAVVKNNSASFVDGQPVRIEQAAAR